MSDKSTPEETEEESVSSEPTEEKSVVFRLPRYEKRSLATIMMAFVLPSAIYALRDFALTNTEALWRIVSFFAHPLAVVFNTYTSWGYSRCLSVSCVLQIILMIWLKRSSKLTPKMALTIAIVVGMLDLLGLKMLSM